MHILLVAESFNMFRFFVLSDHVGRQVLRCNSMHVLLEAGKASTCIIGVLKRINSTGFGYEYQPKVIALRWRSEKIKK